jgi:hypothetical protein
VAATATLQAPVRQRVMVRLSRTPGRLALIMAGLVVLGLAAGGAGVLSVRDRSDLVRRVTATSGPLAVAAQDLYRALSDADATAASAFLSGGLEPAPQRARYEADIAAASAALTKVAGGVTEGVGVAAAGLVAAQLPVYTGLVETARTLNRQRLPLGAAYLREASGLMRRTLLPAAQEVYSAVTARLAAARDDAAGFPWIALPLGLLALAGLIVGQVYLTRRTNRVFNPGLVAATAVGLAAVLWLGVAWVSAAGHLNASRRDGSEQVELLSQARILALQARGDESLTLVARGSGAAFEKRFADAMTRLVGENGSGGLLGQARGEATDPAGRAAADVALADARQWRTVHADIRRLDDDGDYVGAVGLAVGADRNSAANVFGRLDTDLARGITHGSDRFSREANRAGGVLSGVSVGIGALTVLLMLCVVAGMQRRIVEYR